MYRCGRLEDELSILCANGSGVTLMRIRNEVGERLDLADEFSTVVGMNLAIFGNKSAGVLLSGICIAFG